MLTNCVLSIYTIITVCICINLKATRANNSFALRDIIQIEFYKRKD